MGIISDAIDALEDWCCDLFKDGIKSQFDSISELLTDTFAQTTGSGSSGGLVSSFITQHPSQFNGGGTGGTTIWTTIETLCNNVVVPLGGFILTIILLNELCQMVLRGNNFKDFDDSIFIKWIIKALCGVILVANTYYIASALFSFGTTVCSNGLATLFGSGDYLSETLSINRTALSGLSLGELMTVWFISLIVHLGVLILIVAIVITLASRIIEVFMYLSIAPIPMATMMDSGEWASIGKNWIKQLLALSFQGFFIIVALGIFKTLFSNAIVSLNASSDGVILQMGMLLGYTAALIFTIYKHFIENEPSVEKMPLLSDLQRELKNEGEIALRVSNSLEMFVNGSQNLFNHRTNIDMTNRIICFDIKELGNQLKKVGMLIVQDTVWNRVSSNREKKKITRYYIDEFHLLLKEEQTAKYSAEIWKRFRKWGGVPTGITQNVKDLLSSQEVENIFDNSDFVYMLNQAAGDRDILAEKLHISKEQMKYVTNSGPGEGLIRYDKVLLPFTDHFPTNTEMYRLMTTKPNGE